MRLVGAVAEPTLYLFDGHNLLHAGGYADKRELTDTLVSFVAVRGARVITVPSAFTVPTTRDHWEVLLRARAIEDQCFVVAANQVGRHGEGGPASGGRSMIVDPWGVVLACAPDSETFIVADLDLDAQADVRRKLPSLANRRPEVYA